MIKVVIFSTMPLELTTRARLGFLEYMSACVYPRQAGNGTQSAICTLACMDKRTQKYISDLAHAVSFYRPIVTQ